MSINLPFLLLFFSLDLIGQGFQRTSICKNLVVSDSVEFKKSFIKAKHLPSTKDFKKTKNSIKIALKDTTYIFKDQFEKDGYNSYSFKTVGFDSIRKWVLVRGQDEQTNLFYLINLSTSKIDTLIGEPKIYKSKIICLESGYTDSPWNVEIWSIQKDNIMKERIFSLAKCGIHGVKQIYLFGNTLFISNYSDKFWKARVLE